MLECIIPDVHDKGIYTGYISYGLGVCRMCRSMYIGGKNRFEKLTAIDCSRRAQRAGYSSATAPSAMMPLTHNFDVYANNTSFPRYLLILVVSLQPIPPSRSFPAHGSLPDYVRHIPRSARLAQVSSSPVCRSGVGVRRANGASAGDGWIRRIHTRPAIGRVFLGRAVGLG